MRLVKSYFFTINLQKIVEAGSPKGEIFNTARCAGIMAAKNKRNNTSMPYYKSKWH